MDNASYNQDNIYSNAKNSDIVNASIVHTDNINNDNKCITPSCCHHPLRLWTIKFSIKSTPKFIGVSIVQAKDLKNAECIFLANSRFNGFKDRISIECIEEVLPNPDPILLQEDTVAILDRSVLKSYPFLLKEDFCKYIDMLNNQFEGKLINEGISTEIIDTNINLRYDPEDFEIDEQNRIKLKKKKIQSDYLHNSEYHEDTQELVFTPYVDNGYDETDYLNDVEYNNNTLNILEYAETN